MRQGITLSEWIFRYLRTLWSISQITTVILPVINTFFPETENNDEITLVVELLEVGMVDMSMIMKQTIPDSLWHTILYNTVKDIIVWATIIYFLLFITHDSMLHSWLKKDKQEFPKIKA